MKTIAVLLLCVGAASAAPQPMQDPAPLVDEGLWKRLKRRYDDAVKSGDQKEKGYSDRIKKLYKKAKDAGEDVPSDVGDWIKQDLENLRRWYYKVETIASMDDDVLTKWLGELGEERWECFHAEKTPTGTRVFCKRRARSYLGMIPLRQLLLWGGEGE